MRRRQGNPLLMRIFLISVGVHIVLLPILAYFGAFKKIQQGLSHMEVMVLPPPPEERSKPVETHQKQTKKPAQTKNGAKKAGGPKSNLNQPKVVADKSDTASDHGPTVDANGSGVAGQLPSIKKQVEQPVAKTGSDGTDKTEVAKKDIETPSVTKPTVVNPDPPVKAITPKPLTPVFTSAEPDFTPLPVIPDELRTEDLSASMIVEFTVSKTGEVADSQVIRSCGVKELDRVALETVKRWKFRPATIDGLPTQGKVRLTVEFEVR